MFARHPKPHRQTGAKKIARSANESTATIATRNVQSATGAPRQNGVFDPASDLGQLLRTNLSPTDAQKEDMKKLKISLAKEARECVSLAAQKRAEISEHENAISRLRKEIAELEQKAKRARKDISCASSLLSPIRVLPSEIMGEIFVACLKTRVFACTTEAPLLLCRVCSAWREIARSTPALWSQLTINRLTADSVNKFIPTWFDLAGDLPLSLSLVKPRNSVTSIVPSLPVLQYTTDNVLPVWRRIEELTVSVPYWDEAQSIVEDFSGVLPTVKHLSIEFQFPSLSQRSQTMLLPNLRKLSVFRWSPETGKPEQESTDFPMPFGRLTATSLAKLTYISMSDVTVIPALWHSLFVNCRALEYGTFMLSGDPLTNGHMDPVSFPFLHSLEVIFKKNGNWSILNRFSFPTLRHLRLGSVEGLSVWNEEALMNIQSRRLESLTLFKVKVRPDDLNDFLRSTPTLQSFLAHLPLDYTPLLQGLSIPSIEEESENNKAWEDQTEVLLPDLRKLTIYHWQSINKTVDVNIRRLVAMIKDRYSPGSQRSTAPPGKRLERVSVWAGRRAGLKLDTLKSTLRRSGRKV